MKQTLFRVRKLLPHTPPHTIKAFDVFFAQDLKNKIFEIIHIWIWNPSSSNISLTVRIWIRRYKYKLKTINIFILNSVNHDGDIRHRKQTFCLAFTLNCRLFSIFTVSYILCRSLPLESSPNLVFLTLWNIPSLSYSFGLQGQPIKKSSVAESGQNAIPFSKPLVNYQTAESSCGVSRLPPRSPHSLLMGTPIKIP